MPQRVFQQVDQRLAQKDGIAQNRKRLGAGRKSELQVPRERLGGEGAADILDRRVQVERLHRGAFVVAEAFERQQLLGQPRQVAGRLKQLLLAFRALQGVADPGQRFGQRKDRRGGIQHLVRRVRDEGLMRLDAVLHLAQQAVEGRHDARDLVRDGTADRAEVIRRPPPDRRLQVVQGAQADLHPEPDDQGECGHQPRHQRRRPQGQLVGKAAAVAHALPDRHDRITGQGSDRAAFDQAHHAHRLAAIVGQIVERQVAGHGHVGPRRIGVAGDVDPAGAGDMIEQLSAARVRDDAPGAGRQRVPFGDRDIARDREGRGQKGPVEQLFGRALRHLEPPPPQKDRDDEQRGQDHEEQPQPQRHRPHGASTSSMYPSPRAVLILIPNGSSRLRRRETCGSITLSSASEPVP